MVIYMVISETFLWCKLLPCNFGIKTCLTFCLVAFIFLTFLLPQFLFMFGFHQLPCANLVKSPLMMFNSLMFGLANGHIRNILWCKVKFCLVACICPGAWFQLYCECCQSPVFNCALKLFSAIIMIVIEKRALIS